MSAMDKKNERRTGLTTLKKELEKIRKTVQQEEKINTNELRHETRLLYNHGLFM